MHFYDRQKELDSMRRTREIAFNETSQMTVVTGRRRIGKTKLILKSCEGTPTVYLFVSRNSETTLCRQFSQTLAQELQTFVPQGITSFRDFFQLCMQVGKSKAFNLVIDEFQEFMRVNPAIFSDMQHIWDINKDDAHVNLIVSGSVYSLMHHIFQNYQEPLYGRATSILRVKPFSPSVLKQIISDYSPQYTSDDLLALYAFTGGVPKYVELLMDRGAFTVNDMIDDMIDENSLFIEEGNILLIQEFGKNYGNYYSILSSIAGGVNEPPRIASLTGLDSLGGSLQRLEVDYDLIEKVQPVGAKPGSHTLRYRLKDHFLRFWFRFVEKNQSLVQSGKFDLLRQLVKRNYADYSGHELEDYFRDKISETEPVEIVGGWWKSSRGNPHEKDNQHEIDIVAVYYGQKKVLLAEVKRNRQNFKLEKFNEKVALIRTKLFQNYDIQTCCLSLEDM